MVADALAVAASGLAIFVAPGALLLRVAGLRFERGETFAYAFAASLALLTATFAGLLALSLPIAQAPAAILLAGAASCALARFLPSSTPRTFPGEEEPAASFPRYAVLLLGALAMLAAVVFAPVGSVDRWWYLAYVRSFAQAPLLTLAEPFLGSGQPFARFGVHPWLFGLAVWSRVSGVDPVAVYENAAPVVAVLASLSAATAMARTLIGFASGRRLAVIASLLLWCGGVVPLLARAGEDKILAAGALVPLCFAALLRLIRDGSDTRDALLLLLVAVATAAVHSLDYAFVLVVALPVAGLAGLRGDGSRRSVVVAVVVLLAVAVLPAASGLVVRSRLHDIGAELSAADHPVVRVHEGRDRLVEVPSVGYLVSPRLLLHPLLLLALFALPLLRARHNARSDGSEAFDASPAGPWRDESARTFLVVATLLPALIAFVPPLPLLAGSVIPPWMVYRVLWLIPAAPLAAVGAQALAKRQGYGESAAAVVLLLLGLPIVADSARDRLAEVRGRLASPRSAGFLAAVDAVRALPADSLVVAAPELAERLPALTARHVVAALDRSTIVFTGSRALGEARLRARASLLAGDDDGATLATDAGLVPTHALYDPRGFAKPSCAGAGLQWEGYALCALDLHRAASSRQLPVATEAPSRVVAEGTCGQAAPSSRRDPWSAAAPLVDCRVQFPSGPHENLYLAVDASTGRAADELRVSVRSGGALIGLATLRVSGDSSSAIALPHVDGDAIDVRVASSFLPFVKVGRVVVTAR